LDLLDEKGGQKNAKGVERHALSLEGKQVIFFDDVDGREVPNTVSWFERVSTHP
jgi:hypothetical protein